MRQYSHFIGALLCFWLLNTTNLMAQSGNQILDGIGETGLVARYLFNGNLKDWSRNSYQATSQNAQETFVRDTQFGSVLSLASANKAYINIPAEAVSGEESLSIMGWITLNSAMQGQQFFDFGKNEKTHLFVAPTGAGVRSALVNGSTKYEMTSPAVELNKWHHIALVIDIPSRSIRTYLNGKLVSEAKNMRTELGQLFDKDYKLYIGRSLSSENTYLDARLYDFRIYRIPLSETQIAAIHSNALKGNNPTVRQAPKKVDNLPVFAKTIPQLYNQFLTSVADVQVETAVGYLPRLPVYTSGVYSNGVKGPRVRIIWPAPTDNQEVLQPGQYTITGSVAGTMLKPKAIVTVKAANPAVTPKRKLEAFKLEQVSLNTGNGQNTKFTENRNKFISTLAATNADAFLYMFRSAFGQPQPPGAQALGGWDTQETKLRGHATGHYLTAIAQAYASTGYDKALQATFKEKMEYMVNTLHQLAQLSGKPYQTGGVFVADPAAVPFGPGKPGYDSDLTPEGIRTDYWNWGKGFISAYPPDQFIMLEKGANYGGQKTQIWAPYYTLHKILAGLLDVYEVTGNIKALEIANGMGDWVHARLSVLPKETLISMWNRYIAGEFGGMNEAMARLYRLTNEPRYLKVAQLFDNIKVFYGNADHAHGLARNVDSFRGLHANQHIPQILGALEMYRDSGNPDYYRIADNFWYKARYDYMYSIGGVAGARTPNNAECFIGQPATLYENGLAADGQNETCATYNMLKLTSNLFLYNPDAGLMDYYERALYNHILASVAEDSPANTYHVPLRPGSVKQFGNGNMTGFTCCNGTSIESNTKMQHAIYHRSADNKELYLNLFVASTLNWTERNISITQTTSFPNEGQTKLTIKGGGQFDLKVRVPAWATKGFFVTINGKAENVKAEPGTYISLNRKWKTGDVVELRMPFQFHLDPVMDQQNIASLFYGPVLLAAQEPEPRTDWRKVTFDGNDIGKSIQGDPKKLEFTIDGTTYKPFYNSYGRHSVYLDVQLRPQ